MAAGQWLPMDQSTHAAWTSQACSEAEGGHLEVLKWLRANGCPLPRGVMTAAAKGGRLEVLKYLRTNPDGFEWNERTCSFAAREGHAPGGSQVAQGQRIRAG